MKRNTSLPKIAFAKHREVDRDGVESVPRHAALVRGIGSTAVFESREIMPALQRTQLDPATQTGNGPLHEGDSAHSQPSFDDLVHGNTRGQTEIPQPRPAEPVLLQHDHRADPTAVSPFMSRHSNVS